MYNYVVFYTTADGRRYRVDCHQSSNIAVGIAKIQLSRGAQEAHIEVTQIAAEQELK